MLDQQLVDRKESWSMARRKQGRKEGERVEDEERSEIHLGWLAYSSLTIDRVASIRMAERNRSEDAADSDTADNAADADAAGMLLVIAEVNAENEK